MKPLHGVFRPSVYVDESKTVFVQTGVMVRGEFLLLYTNVLPLNRSVLSVYRSARKQCKEHMLSLCNLHSAKQAADHIHETLERMTAAIKNSFGGSE